VKNTTSEIKYPSKPPRQKHPSQMVENTIKAMHVDLRELGGKYPSKYVPISKSEVKNKSNKVQQSSNQLPYAKGWSKCEITNS
jgi:hypothetical protein